MRKSLLPSYTVPCKLSPVGRQRKPAYQPQSWDAGRVRALRQHLGLSQSEMAGEVGTRQQTISEWETGQYRPRGASAKLLSIIAESAGFEYEAGGRKMGKEQ